MPGPYDSGAVRRSGPYADGGPSGPRGPYAGGADADEAGPSSLFRQFTGLVGAMPSGIVRMGADIAQDAYAVPMLQTGLAFGALAQLPGGADIVERVHRNRVIRPFVGEEMVTNAAGGMGFTEQMHASMPFMGSMGTSLRGTGERVVNQTAALAPGGLAAGEGAYARASREGNIVPVLVEDIGNAALIGSAAAGGLRRAAAPATARSQAAEAAARAAAPLETGGATAATSQVVPAAGTVRRWFAADRRQIAPTARQTARAERVASAPSDAAVAAEMGAPTSRVFEVGGAGPAATVQVVDDAAATAARASADALAARALRLQRAARKVRTAARMGDTLADTPATVWTKPIGMAARGINPAIDAIRETETGGRLFARADETVGQAIRNQRGRAEFRRWLHEEGELPKVEGAGEIRQAAIAAEQLLDDPIEGYAGHLVVSGVADAMGPTIRGMQDDLGAQLGVDPAVARRWAIEEALGDIEQPKDFDPVDAFELADAYARTRAYTAEYRAAVDAGNEAPPRPPDLLDPEQMQRIDAAQEVLREGVREARESRYFRGWGESKGPRPEEEAARVTQELIDQGEDPRVISAKSEAAAAAARQRETDVLAGRREQRGSEPLSVVVRKATERFAPKIDAAIERVLEAQARAAKADEKRVLPAEDFGANVRVQVMHLYEQARTVAASIVETDPYLARAIAAPDPRITVSDEALVDLVAGRLVSARGSRNPELRQLMEDLADAGWEMPFDLPNPAKLAPAERRAGAEAQERVFARQATADEGTAATATRQLEDWQAKPQPIVFPREGATSSLEARVRASDSAQTRAANGPNVQDVDLGARDRRRAAAGEAFGVEVRPGEPFRVPRDKITGEAAMPQPLQSFTDADGNVREGMLVELDMRGATLHPQVGGVSEVTPGRFMPNERVFLAYGDEGTAIGYLAVYGDTGLSIAVDPAARGQGVGVRLYEAAEEAGIDVHRNLADETFTLEGARTYERFVNGAAEAERVTFDRPVQRQVFDKAAAAETAEEARDRIARQGEQQTIGDRTRAEIEAELASWSEAWAQNTDERNAALNARGALMDANDDLKRLPWSALDDLDGLRARGGAYAELADVVDRERAAVAREAELTERNQALNAELRDAPSAPESLPEGEFTPELNRRLDQHLAEFQDAGQRALYELEGEWEGRFGEADFLEFLPRQAFKASDAQSVPTEWEWFVALPPATQKMIRTRYMAPDPAADARRVNKGYPRDPRVGTGSSPDEVAQFYRGGLEGGTNANYDVGVEEAMAEYVRMIELRDSLERVVNPRSRASEADIEMAAERMGMDPAVLKALRTTEGGRSRKAMLERLAQVAADELAADALGPEPQAARGGRRSPWEMPVDEYVAELTEVEATLAAWAEAHPVVDTGDVFDDVMEPPEVVAARDRVTELALSDFDDFEAPLAADALHARILDAARKHGLVEGEAPAPSRVFDPIARGAEAVADVEQKALEAFIEDTENRKVYRSSGQTLPREDYLYHTLDEPARRIYRQMVADTKVLTETQRLELARRQLGQKLIARGRNAQAPLSRQEGRLVARERILTTRAEQSQRRVNTARERLDAGPDRYEARTDAMGRTLGTFGRGQRTIGVKEGQARARELDLGQAERTLINLLDRQARAEADARLSPEAAPARYATLLRAGGNLKTAIEAHADFLDATSENGRGGDVLRTLLRDIPQNVYDATRLAGDAVDPEFLIGGGRERAAAGASLGRLDEALPYIRKTGQERVKSRTEGGTDFTIRGQAIAEIKRYTDGVRNEVARRAQEKFGVRPDDLGVELRGRDLVEEMKARDFVPWDPANPLLTPAPNQVTGQTTFIPRQLMIAFKKSSFGEKPRWEQNLNTWYDRRFLGSLKTWWLALSPRWQIGNLIGNTLMAVIGGGVDPVTLVRQMRNARALLAEDPTGELLARQQHLLATRGNIPRALLNRGMTHEEMTFLNPELDRPVRNPIARLARRSYAMNEFTDNMFRSAVYLAKAEPRAQLWDDLDAGRISSTEFLGRVGDTLSAKQALEGALHAAGDFQNLTGFERSVIKRLWIFYPWYRHITKLALSLPVNHPTRVIWTLHIAAVFGDDDQDQLPPFLQGSIPLGGDRFLRTGNLNPFGGVQDSPLLSPGSAIAGLTPAITWPAAVLMGVDLSRGGAPISRPPGTERLDAYGRPTNTPLWRNPGELFRYAVNQFPQGRAAYGLTEDPVLRYGQGSPVLVQGETVPTGSSRWAAGARLFGIPMPETVDVESITTRRAERVAAARTARERYAENLGR